MTLLGRELETPGQERVQAAVSAPREVVAQIGAGMVAGSALEPGKIGGHCKPQMVSMLEQGGLGGD